MVRLLYWTARCTVEGQLVTWLPVYCIGSIQFENDAKQNQNYIVNIHAYVSVSAFVWANHIYGVNVRSMYGGLSVIVIKHFDKAPLSDSVKALTNYNGLQLFTGQRRRTAEELKPQFLHKAVSTKGSQIPKISKHFAWLLRDQEVKKPKHRIGRE